jgi:hypothetical protein
MQEQFAAEFMELRQQQELAERRLRWLLAEVKRAAAEQRSADAMLKAIEATQIDADAIDFRIREFLRQAEQVATEP